MSLDLGGLYEHWSDVDANFRQKAPTFTGVRILNQDAWEALIAFICSSNNNISRISQMVRRPWLSGPDITDMKQVHKLCKHYGPMIGHIEDEAFHDFPSPEGLTGKDVESHLRELGFGYRAKYIAETARIVAREKPADWLETLRNPENPGFATPDVSKDKHTTYKEAHEELLSLKGVGPKVADCVCLMGLGWGESVPVDTHVWQIAQRDYKFGKKAKTFNKVMYDAVGDHFRGLWGKYAGWAHSVLFTADLKQFADREVDKVKEEPGFEEAKAELGESTVGRKRKGRRTIVKIEPEAEIKTEIQELVKVEEDSDGMTLDTKMTAKRRRLRPRR